MRFGYYLSLTGGILKAINISWSVQFIVLRQFFCIQVVPVTSVSGEKQLDVVLKKIN